jgi:hypothetical protein
MNSCTVNSPRLAGPIRTSSSSLPIVTRFRIPPSCIDFLAIALLFLCSTPGGFAQGWPPPAVCPTGDDRAINGIETFLESDLVADIRNEVGLEGASISDFDPLTNVDDGYICDALNDDFDKRMQDDTWTVTYYKTPGHSPSQYVVVVGPAPPDPESNNVILGRTFIYVFDQSLDFINGFAH